MAGPTRETVMLALFSLLQTVPGFRTFDRRPLLPTEFTPDLQPALLLLDLGEDTKRQEILAKRTWHPLIIGYVRAPKGTPGITIINPLLDAIDVALAPPPGTGKQTLGGLVDHCWVEGETTKNTGDTDEDGQGGFSVPLKIVIP